MRKGNICNIISFLFIVYMQRVTGIRITKLKSVRQLLSIPLLVSLAIQSTPINPVNAFGPTEIELKITNYKPVELCNGQKPIMPGQKAALGLFPVCIEVDADTINPETSKSFTDVGVYGFVKEDEAGNSVLPNNPDFRSDSGQYAMIKNVPPGNSHVTFQFVAAVSADPKKEKIPSFTFLKTKGIAYPGGSKFKPLCECEIDPRADGCDDEVVEE